MTINMGTIIIGRKENYTQRLDYDSNGDVLYMGQGETGMLESEPYWQIKKFSYDSSGNLLKIIYADGNENKDNVWNDRASLSYS